jgi:arylformamidase
MKLIDISPTLSPRTAVWPGDQRLERKVLCSIADGANIELSSVTTTVHIGAHADAPIHYHPQGQGISERPLERYYGPCQVMQVDVQRGERITTDHLLAPVTAPRVLFRTDSFPDPDRFTEDFASLSPGLVDHLAAQGVVLVGIDTPSIDPFSSKALESHQAIYANDLAVLEGLVLSHVEPGAYTLIALPLKLQGADASPVRAALIP